MRIRWLNKSVDAVPLAVVFHLSGDFEKALNTSCFQLLSIFSNRSINIFNDTDVDWEAILLDNLLTAASSAVPHVVEDTEPNC